MNLRPLGYEPYDARLLCLGESLVSALTSADLRDDVDSVPPCLPRLKLSRCVRFTNRLQNCFWPADSCRSSGQVVREPVAVTVAISRVPGNGWAGATRLCAWCENPIPARALRDAVASNWTDAAGKAPRSFGRVRWIVADL